MGNKIIQSFVLMVLSFNSFASNIDSLFKEGNRLYKEDKFSDALINYNTINKKGYYSKELFLNLGNCYYRLDSIAQAVLHYEKGLKISPGDDDITSNLEHIYNETQGLDNPIKKSIFISDVIYSFLGKSVDYWAYASIYLLSFFSLLILLYKISYNVRWKKINFYSSIIVFILFLVTVGLAWISKNKYEDTSYGIVFSKKNEYVKTFTQPSESANAKKSLELHIGSKVKIKNENKNWVEISYNDIVGWIPKKNINRI